MERPNETELAALREQVARFRSALERIAADAVVPLDQVPDADQPNGWRDLAVARVNIARAALEN